VRKTTPLFTPFLFADGRHQTGNQHEKQNQPKTGRGQMAGARSESAQLLHLSKALQKTRVCSLHQVTCKRSRSGRLSVVFWRASTIAFAFKNFCKPPRLASAGIGLGEIPNKRYVPHKVETTAPRCGVATPKFLEYRPSTVGISL